jgi:RHS repeat-associated protein
MGWGGFNRATSAASTSTQTCAYAGSGYANPDAVTQIANGLSTSTFSYDNNGNLTQKTTDGVTTTYVYDYANRLIALGSQGATTTYGYDAFGSRVFQSTGTTTNLYPFKWYSVASSTGTGAKYATTTEYVFNADTLVSTTDQQIASGAATGTAQTRFIHPDHLGSTNVVTNASGTVVQTLDYYPYGATRISASSGGADSDRKYIGQFADASNLDYLNARYYDSARGQFLSQDPTFLALGDRSKLQQITQENMRQFLEDPQQLNSYSYATNNPVTDKDPNGKQWEEAYKFGELFSRGLYTRDISGYVSNGMPSDQTPEIEFKGAMVTGGIAAQYLPFIPAYFGPQLLLADGSLSLLSYACSFATCGPLGSPGMTPVQIQRLVYSSTNVHSTISTQLPSPTSFGTFNSLFSGSVQTRIAAATTINSSAGLSGSGTASSPPSNNSLWVTPSGAVVTFGGQLVAPPPANK